MRVFAPDLVIFGRCIRIFKLALFKTWSYSYQTWPYLVHIWQPNFDYDLFIVKIPEIDCWIDKGRFVGFNIIWKIIIFKTNIFWQLVNYLTNTLFFVTKWGLNWTLKPTNNLSLLEAHWECGTLIGQNPKEHALERHLVRTNMKTSFSSPFLWNI